MKYEKTIEIDPTIIYNSKSSGPYNIVREIEPDIHGRRVEVLFHNTNNTGQFSLYRAIKGEVFDRIKNSIDYTKIYQSKNYGPFIFIEELPSADNGCRMCNVKFLNTNSIITCGILNALKGSIKDPYALSVCGVACIGKAPKRHYLYEIWRAMINRCYNPNNPTYRHHGAMGVTVDNRWLCFENFIQDVPLLPGYNDWANNNFKDYALDKDYLQQHLPINQRIYSPHTCCLLPIRENTRLGSLERANTRVNSQYIGVRKVPSGKYSANIETNGINNHIGTFDNEKDAAIAYNNAAIKLGFDKRFNNQIN